MNNVITGAILIALGCFLIVFRKWFTLGSMDAQNRMFGFKYSEEQVRRGYLLSAIAGLISITYGLLIMFEVVK